MQQNNATPSGAHHLISPTAGYVAFLRSFSDIPCAKAISDDIDGERIARDIYPESGELLTRLTAPVAEARYKCFDRFISRYKNILELAVGTSIGRGIEIATRYPDKTYVGTDLPDMLELSRSLFEKYYSRRDNHHLLPANVLNPEQLEAAVEKFGPGEVLIVSEGLWMYLSREERVAGANSIKKILERTGGEWVTPDFTDRQYEAWVRASLDPEIARSFEDARAAVTKLTTRNTAAFMPQNTDQLLQFFADVGLHATATPMFDASMKLSSLERLWSERPYPYERLLGSRRLWILRPN